MLIQFDGFIFNTEDFAHAEDRSSFRGDPHFLVHLKTGTVLKIPSDRQGLKFQALSLALNTQTPKPGNSEVISAEIDDLLKILDRQHDLNKISGSLRIRLEKLRAHYE